MNGHTPGPWTYDRGVTFLAVHTADKRRTVHFNTGPENSTLEAEANARLIAAAPDLLETLTGMHKALSRMIYKHDNDSIEAEWLSHSNEAIRKATGHDIQF